MLSFDLNLQKGDFHLEAAAQLPAMGITGLIGSSGSGKTSLLRALAGLEKRCHGKVSLNTAHWLNSEAGVELPTHRRSVGLVFQHPSLFPHLNVEQNLRYAWDRAPQANRQMTPARAAELLAMGHLLQRHPQSLSGGEAQRVAIARALCSNPSLLLLDEPLVSVDVEGRQAILAQLEALRDELTMPMIYVSHSLDEVARLSEHLMLLEAGQLKASGPVQEMLTRFDLPLAHAAEAEAILDARVMGYDADSKTSHLETVCGLFHVTQALTPGTTQRLRIMARDVSLALSHAQDSSILNILPAIVEDIADEQGGQRLVRIRAGGGVILARLSYQSVNRLGLAKGMQVFAQIKSVALA